MLQLIQILAILGNPHPSQELEIYPARSITIIEGERLIMTCISEQNQNLKWTHDEKQISNTTKEQRAVTQTGSYTSELFFKAVREIDKGNYTCAAASTNKTRKLNIIPKVDFHGTPNQITTIAGEETNLTCTVKVSTPPNKIFWSSENGPIRNNNKYKINYKQPETISVKNISIGDEGSYTCHVSHATPDGSITQKTNTFINVLLKPSIRIPEPPIIKDSSLTLECAVSARPTVDIQWFFSDQNSPVIKKIQNTSTTRIQNNPNNSTLYLRNITSFGKYFCRAINRIGASALIYTIHKQKPVFISRAESSPQKKTTTTNTPQTAPINNAGHRPYSSIPTINHRTLLIIYATYIFL